MQYTDDEFITLLYVVPCWRLGAILVFLPGYDEIMTLRDRIQDEKRFSDSSRSVVVWLFSVADGCMHINHNKVAIVTPHIAAEHVSFNYICQVLPICTPL